MLWIALVVGLMRTLRACGRGDIKPQHVVDVGLYGLLGGIASAHLASILLDFSYYWRNTSEILGLWSGILSPSGGLRGLSFHGGLVGAVGVAILYCRRRGISFGAMADLCSPGLALGYAIARIGCFLNGCCQGIPTNLPWAVSFHLDAVSGELGPPSHPTQLYAAAAGILIYIALVAIEKRRRFVGQVFLSYLAAYSVYRFLIEFLRRGVSAEIAFAGITEAQVVSLFVLAVAGVLLLTKSKRRASPDVRTPVREMSSRCEVAATDGGGVHDPDGG